MQLFSHWSFFVGLYLFFAVSFDQNYKQLTTNMVKAGPLTVLVEGIAGLCSLLFLPFFPFILPTNPLVYLFLGAAIVFYALQGRLGTVARSGLSASTYSVIKQLSTVFMILFGLLFLREPFVLWKVVGSCFILVSNVLVLYEKKHFVLRRSIVVGMIANLCLTIALLIDVNYASQFNLAFYVMLILFLPALFIFLVERIKIKEFVVEVQQAGFKKVLWCSCSWSLMMLTKLRSYQLGSVLVVAPLCSLTVILNVVVGFLFFQERRCLVRKVLAGLFILVGVLLIKS